MERSLEEPEYLVSSEPEDPRNTLNFSDTETHVRVQEYGDRTVYSWKTPLDFGELVDAVEPYFPINRRLETVSSDSRYTSDDHDYLQPDMVHDPIADQQQFSRWAEYSLIKMNFTDFEVFWQNSSPPYRDPTVKVIENSEDVDGFEKIFSRTVEDGEELLEDIGKVV